MDTMYIKAYQLGKANIVDNKNHVESQPKNHKGYIRQVYITNKAKAQS